MFLVNHVIINYKFDNLIAVPRFARSKMIKTRIKGLKRLYQLLINQLIRSFYQTALDIAGLPIE